MTQIAVINYSTAETLRHATADDLDRALDCDRDTGAFTDEHGVTVYLDGCAFDGESYDLSGVWFCMEEGSCHATVAYGETATDAAHSYAVLTWIGEGRSNHWLEQRVVVRSADGETSDRIDITIDPADAA